MLVALTLAMALAMAQASPASAAFGFLTTWGGTGTTNGKFQAPFGVATDASGNVYVADCQVNRVQKFDANGEYKTQWGTTGKGATSSNAPAMSQSTRPACTSSTSSTTGW